LSYDYNRNNSIGNANGKTGHLTKIVNNLDNNKNREYEFDALGRLTKAKGGNGGNLWTQNYSFDRYGNRTNVTASGVAADNSPIPVDGIPNLTYNSTTNRITTTGFEYDSAGNQTRSKAEDGTWLKYEYDAANRLRVVKKDDNTLLQSFQYGSTNARLMDLDYQYGYLKIFASAGGTTLSEYTEFAGAIPSWTKSYIYLGDSQFSTIMPNGSDGETVEYNHSDKLGIRLTTNQTTGTSYEQTTLPFGTALNAETTRSESKRFTSYERSARTGLDYAINRTYDSKLGRFSQIDPIGMKAVNLNLPQTLNLYNYCGNDPINYTDFDGLSWLSKFFRIFKSIVNAITNIIKIAVAVAIIVSLFTNPIGWAATLGVVSRLLYEVIVPNLIKIVTRTIYRNIKLAIQEEGLSFGSFFKGLWRGIKQSFRYIKAVFTRKLKDFFVPVYGYWCAPGHGVDGPTGNQAALDELDAACQEHDLKMREINDLLASGQISKKQAKKMKTKADLKFMRKALTSSNMASGTYLLFLQLGFLFRIVFR
jgi:RHS repeat-associated protein